MDQKIYKEIEKICNDDWNKKELSKCRIEDKQYYIGWLKDKYESKFKNNHWDYRYPLEHLYTNVETLESFLINSKYNLDSSSSHVIECYFSDVNTITDEDLLNLLKKYPNKFNSLSIFIDHFYHYEKNLLYHESYYDNEIIIYKFPKAHDYCKKENKRLLEEREAHKKYVYKETEKLNKAFRKQLNTFIQKRKDLGNPVEIRTPVGINSMPGMTVMHGDDDRWIIMKI